MAKAKINAPDLEPNNLMYGPTFRLALEASGWSPGNVARSLLVMSADVYDRFADDPLAG
ncbi:hypothetical protein [Mesorhizobium sp. A623]